MEIRIFNFISNDELKLWIALGLHLWHLTAGIISMLQCALQHPKFIQWTYSTENFYLNKDRTLNKEISS